MIGITIGMVVFILIMLYVNFEYSVDQYHKSKEKIFRIARQERGSFYLGSDHYALTMAPLGPALMEEIPEIEYAARILRIENSVIYMNSKSFYQPEIHAIDPQAFKMFSFDHLYGDPSSYLLNKYSVVVSQSWALKHYPGENPIGQSFSIKGDEKTDHTFTISGVIKDMPSNSHFIMDVMIPFTTLVEITKGLYELQNWLNNNYYTYIQLRKGGDQDLLESKIADLLGKHIISNDSNGDPITLLYLQEFSKIHLYSDVHFDIGQTGNPNRLYILTAIAILIILIACINYMNLNTARAFTRIGEVGIRKVSGASKKNLIIQFIGESMFLVFLSFPVSLIIVGLALPNFNKFFELELSLNSLIDTWLIFMLLGVCIIVGFVSGIYPAFILSRYKLITALKGNHLISSNGNKLRYFLVVVQFAITGFLIVSTFIMMQQLNYIQKKDLGYNREHIIILEFRDIELLDKVHVLKDELLKVPGVLKVASSDMLPNGNRGSNNVRWPGKNENINWQICTGSADSEFIDLYDIEIVKGSDFSEDIPEESGAILINEAAARLLNWDDPIGRELSDWRDTCRIVGVMKDFHHHTLNKEIMPLQLFYYKNNRNISLKVSGYDLKKTLDGIKETKNKFSNKYPFSYAFFDVKFNAEYKKELKAGILSRWITVITIIIANLGLFGLAAFTTEQRSREVCIRKIFGADVYRLFGMLSRDLIIPVLVSFIISIPIGFLIMKKWLSNFAYHIEINLSIFGLAIIVMIFIAWFTVSYQTFKIARQSPLLSIMEE
jgi:putative ABC transport system permease protein